MRLFGGARLGLEGGGSAAGVVGGCGGAAAARGAADAGGPRPWEAAGRGLLAMVGCRARGVTPGLWAAPMVVVDFQVQAYCNHLTLPNQ